MDDAEHSARLEGVMAGHESASQTLRDRRCDCAVEPRHQGGPDRRQVNALIRSQIAALTLTQIVVSGRRVRRSISEQERARSRTDKPWRERPCDFARGQGTREPGGVAHAMVCALSESQTAIAGGTQRRPVETAADSA